VGYMTSWLVTEGDRRADSPLFNIDHLLELWDEIHRRLPNARLWLLGGASKRVLERCAARDDILCLGRIPRDRVLPHVANFDVALYPRTVDHGTGGTAKVIEYMGAGVPTVSYDLPITREVRDNGAGVLVDTEREFVEAVESLGRDETLRRRLAQGARDAGAERDYDILAARYADILDRHL
jgi:glycosyltransferase involved in cell wall biosynthesis